MKIWIIGTWYVWLIQAVWLAKLWHEIVSLDIDENKIKELKSWKAIIYEPGLEELLEGVKDNISFTVSYKDLDNCEIIFVAVWTPQDRRWRTNKDFIHKAAISIKKNLSWEKVIILKSTVPVGTNKEVSEILWEKFYVISNPEFLREGKAIDDFFNPDRVVVWFNINEKETIKEKVRQMYSWFIKKNIPYIETNWETAELIKYAANSFLAMKISFINELARLADQTWANIQVLAKWIGLDKRIWESFLNAWLWYWWSCFPKDVKSLIHQFKENWLDWELVQCTDKVNQKQLIYFFEKIEKFYDDIEGKRFLLLWLAFKPDTDDLRESRSIEIAKMLNEKWAKIYWFDYIKKAMDNVKQQFDFIKVVDDIYSVNNLDGIIIWTEYKQFNDLDWDKLKDNTNIPVIFDWRNILDKEKLKKVGFIYKGIWV